MTKLQSGPPRRRWTVTYGVFDLNVQAESTTGATGITGQSKTEPPRVPRAPRGLLFLNTQVKNALISFRRVQSSRYEIWIL
jgi:hypothetical protein